MLRMADSLNATQQRFQEMYVQRHNNVRYVSYNSNVKKVSIIMVDVMITYLRFACLQTSLFAEHVSIFY